MNRNGHVSRWSGVMALHWCPGTGQWRLQGSTNSAWIIFETLGDLHCVHVQSCKVDNLIFYTREKDWFFLLLCFRTWISREIKLKMHVKNAKFGCFRWKTKTSWVGYIGERDLIFCKCAEICQNFKILAPSCTCFCSLKIERISHEI